MRAYRARGLEGLRPVPRSDVGAVRRHPELLAEAAALRAEVPARSSGAIADMLWRRHGVAVPERTIRDHLRRRGLHRSAIGGVPRAFGRFEAAAPNERWITDVLVGPFVPHPRVAGSRRAKLFLIVDDHSRLLVHGRWMTEENTRAGQDVLREAIARRGLPQALYCDNGAPFANAALERSCAVLGIRLVHSRPYSPQGRGKQERLNRYIRQRFLAEAEAAGIADFASLNDRFMAWAEQVCNTRTHAETNQTPIARFTAGGPPRAAEPAVLADAFRWSAVRLVTKTATISLTGRRFQVDPVLVGRRVELRYDPTDMSVLDVFFDDVGPVPEISVHNAHCPSGEILGNRNGLKKRFGLGGAGNASLTRRVTPETISRTYTVFWNGPGTMSLDSDTKMTSRPSADMFATNAPEIDRAPDGVTLTITSSRVRRSHRNRSRWPLPSSGRRLSKSV